MAAAIEIDASRVMALADRFRQGPETVDREFLKAMQLSVFAIEAEAKEIVPKDTSDLVRSITSTATPVEGRVGTNKIAYAQVMEYGRRPGAAMPPQGALLEWMRRKGIDQSLEYVIRRAIARNGIAGRHYMQKAFEKLKPQVERNFALASEAVARQLAGGR